MTQPVIAAPAAGADLRATVACLALDGCALGWLAGVYPDTADWWELSLRAIADYAAVPVPATRLGTFSDRWERFPLRDEEPLVDAVLTLARTGGTRSVTLDRVARLADRDPEWLDSMYGSAQELVEDVLDRVMSDGFDDLSPLHLTPCRATVVSLLDVLTDDRRAAALLRTLLLSGVEVPGPAAQAARETSPAALPGHAEVTGGHRVAALAMDGWTLGAGSGEPGAEVLAELRALVG